MLFKLSYNNIVVIIAIILFVIIFLTLISGWTNPDININNIKCLQECVKKEASTKKITITSMNNSLKVFFVANSKSTCFNPFFPIIYIKKSTFNHNAWLQIIRTDAHDKSLQIFVDTNSEYTPFYNFNKNFYDAPHWTYTIFNKPLTKWIAHVYAINVDKEKKTIIPLGGVRWGFHLKYYSLNPIAIPPVALTMDDWKEDWLFLQDYLKDYISL